MLYMEIFDKIKSILVKQLKVEENEIKMEASLVDDLGIDSVGLVELIVVLEDEFYLEIPEEDAQKILTVGEAVKYIQERQ